MSRILFFVILMLSFNTNAADYYNSFYSDYHNTSKVFTDKDKMNEENFTDIHEVNLPWINALVRIPLDDGGIFRTEDAKNLSNPNNPIDPKLRGAVRTYNELNPDDPLTLEEAREMVVNNFGLKVERPYERDAYEEVAVSGKILDILNNPTGANVARVSAQGGLPTLTIRDGHQGGHDIVRASIAIGAPPQIAPLAAVVFGNETGWGKYTSGQNNLFNIKSTDGTGTTTMTREGDINIDGGWII